MSVEILDNPNLAKVMLRVPFGLMYLVYGIKKFPENIAGWSDSTTLVGVLVLSLTLIVELVAPIAVMAGYFTRLFSCFIFITCFLIVFRGFDVFAINISDSFSSTSIYMVVFGSLVFLGSGKYAIRPD